ncbi:helix-turn-helix transcriptional regulator [Halapricum hydrolyticum]|uniref:MarR family transcriptional regulator n=1 Tax=Halapricum hydrolyticum TaxID=2979991 RepID=A0AAE3LE68_9EURY|nr:MarR family transcriptional regulator [Halapricum hydrolyticum]MCU4717104.1 MarR family transcriptional regulator [Halapricum hydrolyticum]MCU4726031.1 MarR family transcriptional regulator [Halapricum hydrolyticum]
MDQQTSDRIVAVAVATVLVGGGVLTWQAIQQRQTTHMSGSMMDGSSTMGGTDPTVYAVGTVLAVALLIGIYAIMRGETSGRTDTAAPAANTVQADVGGRPTTGIDETAGGGSSTSTSEGAARTSEAENESDETGQRATADQSEQAGSADEGSRAETDQTDQLARQVLDLLPDDERRILEPVVESPGITQIALRDRSNFSKSKVSQTVSELEKRGLLYREKQGRTYRVYPGDDLGDRLEG